MSAQKHQKHAANMNEGHAERKNFPSSFVGESGSGVNIEKPMVQSVMSNNFKHSARQKEREQSDPD